MQKEMGPNPDDEPDPDGIKKQSGHLSVISTQTLKPAPTIRI